MLNDIKIHQATLFDVEDLKQIGITTFIETFASVNTQKNMSLYITSAFDTKKLENEINYPGSIFYLAKNDIQTVGYLKLNKLNGNTDLHPCPTLEIERIYVAKAYQGIGLGQMLFQYALQIAKDSDLSYVWLGVWEHNQKAIDFYSKNGFEVFDKHIFKLGDDPQTDILMRLYIK